MRTTAKDAVKIATEYFQFVTGNYGVRITPEEVEYDNDLSIWKVTLSYTESAIYYGSAPLAKNYKVFEISDNTGEVLSMKIKE